MKHTLGESLQKKINIGCPISSVSFVQNLFQPLISRENILLPPLHSKIGLMKQFIKALDKTGDCFKYMCQKFPVLNMAKLKASIFDGSQIRTLTKDIIFLNHMTQIESEAQLSFVLVVKQFWGNHKATDYSELVAKMLQNFHALGATMSIKLHFCIAVCIDSRIIWTITDRSKANSSTRTSG